MRKIPATMATQHPDNAGAPYWETDGDGFVSVQEELTECISAFRDLGVEEFMWDWEGKYADEAVIDKFFTEYYQFAKTRRLGEKIFLTFRVPNVWHERGYSLMRALMVILTSEDFARDLKFKNRPLFEVILPMTERADQLMYLHKSFEQLAHFKKKIFNHQKRANIDQLDVIPLVESVSGQLGFGKLLADYTKKYQAHFHKKPPHIRPFLARSDPAMASGLIATVLANKIALSDIAEFSRHTRIKTHPIIGVGSLVFRGGLSPVHYKDFAKQYGGVRTATIQSAFRYDYPFAAVAKSIAGLNRLLPKSAALPVRASDRPILIKIIKRAEVIYQTSLPALVQYLAPIFTAVPRRRERKLHIGFLGYGRNLGGVRLPRAISFTAGFYSLGVPPEFVGLGRLLSGLSLKERAILLKYYPLLKNELNRAARFIAPANLLALSKSNPIWRVVESDIVVAAKILGLSVGPRTKAERLHANYAAELLLVKKDLESARRLITRTGQLRQSLG